MRRRALNGLRGVGCDDVVLRKAGSDGAAKKSRVRRGKKRNGGLLKIEGDLWVGSYCLQSLACAYCAK